MIQTKETRRKYTDEKVNKLIFELYGLSEEEAGIVKWCEISGT